MRPRASAARPLALLALLALPTLLALSTLLATATPVMAKTTAAPYAGPGPYVAGVTTLDLGDRKVEVWYPAAKQSVRRKAKDVYRIRESLPRALDAILPADVNPPFTQDAYRDAPASTKGPFPLVLFAHGFGSYRLQSTFLTSHLAQWGFVVASPDFLERNLGSVLGERPAQPKTDAEVLDAATKRVRVESDTKGSPLAGRVKKGKLAVTGHSAGGFASIVYGRTRNVVTYIPISAGGSGRPGTAVLDPPDTPSLYALGGDDQVVGTADVEQYWANRVKRPKRLVVIGGAGHTSPTDTCDIGNGGLVGTARANGLAIPATFDRLYDCAGKPTVAHDTWPVYDHFVTAQLRWAFGIDKRPVGLDPRAARSFAPLAVTYRQVLR